MELEEFTPGAIVDGLLESVSVEIVSLKWHGTSAAEVTYKNPLTGQINNTLVFREDEYKYAISENGRPWVFDADGSLFRLAQILINSKNKICLT